MAHSQDYFDSGWYFNAGEFRLPVSGMTHLVNQDKNVTEWSAYRFHEMDPLRFVRVAAHALHALHMHDDWLTCMVTMWMHGN